MHGTIHIIRGSASARQAATVLDLVANNNVAFDLRMRSLYPIFVISIHLLHAHIDVKT